jgi:hypothetical protein
MANIKKEIKENKGMFFFGLVLLIVFAILLFLLYNQFSFVEKKEIYSTLEISNLTGFDLNDSMLSFGKIYPGGVTSRSITIQNNWDKTSKVIIDCKGNISEFLIVSENSFFLKPNEKKQVSFSIITNKTSIKGNYDGIIKIKMKSF